VSRSFSDARLRWLREIASEQVLVALSIHVKADSTYVPLKDSDSRRWHAQTTHGDFELITTREKWYDTRAKKGGHGAIDLAMHIMGVPFVQAVKLLCQELPRAKTLQERFRKSTRRGQAAPRC
jgi:dihydrodipicolinate synthase/N-acetylneuraminate lyase